jgi:type I restriction enzyme S subunit
MEKPKNAPKLRFPEFSDVWKRDTVGRHVDFLSGFPFKSEDITDDSTGHILMRGINISTGKIRHSKDLDKYYLGDTTKLKKYLLNKGDLVIGMDGSKVGKNSALIDEQNKDSLLVQRVARLRSIDNSCLPFIYHHINSSKFHAYVDTVKTSSGIPHISAKQIQTFSISFPSLAEQQKIASFLSTVEYKIQQLTRKKSLLEKYKKGVSQKLFNQEIRFKDEDGKDYPGWQQKALSDVADIKGGKRIPKGFELQAENNGLPYITVSDMKNGSVSLEKIRYVPERAKDQIKNYKISVDDIFISVAGTLGVVGIIPLKLNNANLTENANKLTNLKCNQRYLFQLLQSDCFLRLINSVQTVGAQPKLAIYALAGFKFTLPSNNEQKKIADFLTAIDNKINLLAEEIEKTQAFKKGLLQQMFI